MGMDNHKEAGVNSGLGLVGRRSWMWAGLLFLAVGCGEIGGAGQCNGVDSTGMCVTLDSIQPNDTVTGFGITSDVDAFQTADCDGDLTTVDPELFGKHAADVQFTAFLMPQVTSPPAPAFVTWQSYTVEYIASPTNLVTAPALSTQVFAPDNIKLDADSFVKWTMEFVSSQTKAEYVAGGGSSWPPAYYTAIYTFSGTTQFNQGIVLKGSASFSIGNYNNCS